MDALENGEVPTVITTPVLRSIVNIIGNVLNNPSFEMTQAQKRKLRPYITTYAILLDKDESPSVKKQLLKEKCEAFLPTFLDIVGDDIGLFTTRTHKDCPVCGKENLLKLSNHLKQTHNITGDERKRLLKHGFNRTDDKGDEDAHEEEP